jgi:membrane fusion protein, heavy metal efflux system
MNIEFRRRIPIAVVSFVALAIMFTAGVLLQARDYFPASWVNHVAQIVGLGASATGSDPAHAHEEGETAHAAEAVDEHAGHDHAGHSEETSLELSETAQANLGLNDETIQPIEEATFVRSVTVPAIVTERPGRTQLPVSTPMTGVVTHVHAVTGEAVTPGMLLFQMRLTHEDLVTAQKDFLQSVGDLEVEQKEVARLEGASRSGALPGKILLERQYARDKLLASLASQREALRLHGLSAEQIERIERERRLLTELRIYVPRLDDHGHDQGEELQLSERPLIRQTAFTVQNEPAEPKPAPDAAAPLVVQSLAVHKGETVSTGDILCVLADYAELYIEGQAFETDATAIAEAKNRNWKATAVVEQGDAEREIPGLEIAFLANQVDLTARTLPFFVTLTNEVVNDERNDRQQRFITWRYRPGQRMQLRVPVEEWADQLVLPVAAVVKEGPDSFVFQLNGDHFDRIAVHERYRDRTTVVIANDGSLFPGDMVALTGAHQMQLALKNKAGGAIDPHAGHNH